MEISHALAPALSAIETARLRETATLSLLKDAIEFEGQLALQLLPEPPRVDPSSALGQQIDLYV